MSIWRVLSIIPGGGAFAVLAFVLIVGRRGIPWLPLLGIVVSAIAVTWEAVHNPPRLGFWVDGYWFGMPILRTAGVWAGIWAATTVGRHPVASRWEILSWTAVAAIAGVIAGFVIVMLVGPWVGWTGP
jgi:hypothetical protein